MKNFLFLITLLFVSATGHTYYSNQIPNHGHTSAAGDGGPLTNPVITGTLQTPIVTSTSVTTKNLTVSSAATIISINVGNITSTGTATFNNLSVTNFIGGNFINRLQNGNFDEWVATTTSQPNPNGTITANLPITNQAPPPYGNDVEYARYWSSSDNNTNGQNYFLVGQDTTTINPLSNRTNNSIFEFSYQGQTPLAPLYAYFKQNIPNYWDYTGSTVTFSLDFGQTPGSGAANVDCTGCTVGIDDGVTQSTAAAITVSTGSWNRLFITKVIDSKATKLQLQFGRISPTSRIGSGGSINGMVANALFVVGTSTTGFFPAIKSETRGSVNGVLPSTGSVGEYFESVVLFANRVNAATSTQYKDLTSITLPPGNWNVWWSESVTANGATVTQCQMGLGTAAGNVATGFNFGDTAFLNGLPLGAAGTTDVSTSGYKFIQVPNSGATIVKQIWYLKFIATYSVATPQAYGYIRAMRSF